MKNKEKGHGRTSARWEKLSCNAPVRRNCRRGHRTDDEPAYTYDDGKITRNDYTRSVKSATEEKTAAAECGIGVQKRRTNEKDARVRVIGHSEGRDGILVNAELRWNF